MKKLFAWLIVPLTILLLGATAPSRAPLVVTESDGSPKVYNVREIRVSNSTLTNTGGGVVTIAIGSGTVTASGTPTANQWPYWTTATNLVGVSINASKPVCSDSNGRPAVCTGTEGVWQAALTNPLVRADIVDTLLSQSATVPLSANQGYVLKGLVDGKACFSSGTASPANPGTAGCFYFETDINTLYFYYSTAPIAIAVLGADGSYRVSLTNNTAIDPTAASYEMYFDAGIFKYNENGTERTPINKAQTFTQCTTIKDPAATSDHNVFRTGIAITITAAHCLATGGTSLTGGFQECDGNGANCAGIDGATTMVCTAGSNVNDDGTLSNPSIDAGDYINWTTASVDGTQTELIVCFDYTIN